MLRYILFAGTNIAVLMVLSVVLRLLGMDPRSMMGMLIFSAVVGVVGSLISLAMSKSMAIRSMRVQIIETPSSDTERWLVDTVTRQAEAAGIGMPDVGIFDDPSPNAFATGMKKNDALVAVSTGLLNSMDRDEVEAVLGHEVAHVANGDMVTMALLQGVVNAFVLVLSRLLGMLLSRGERGGGMGSFAGYMIGQVVFGFLATLIVKYFSRRREFRADVGGAELAGREKMISALQKLKGGAPAEMPADMQAFGISGMGIRSGLAALTSTHPPLDSRIEALRAAGQN